MVGKYTAEAACHVVKWISTSIDVLLQTLQRGMLSKHRVFGKFGSKYTDDIARAEMQWQSSDFEEPKFMFWDVSPLGRTIIDVVQIVSICRASMENTEFPAADILLHRAWPFLLECVSGHIREFAEAMSAIMNATFSTGDDGSSPYVNRKRMSLCIKTCRHGVIEIVRLCHVFSSDEWTARRAHGIVRGMVGGLITMLEKHAAGILDLKHRNAFPTTDDCLNVATLLRDEIGNGAIPGLTKVCAKFGDASLTQDVNDLRDQIFSLSESLVQPNPRHNQVDESIATHGRGRFSGDLIAYAVEIDAALRAGKNVDEYGNAGEDDGEWF